MRHVMDAKSARVLAAIRRKVRPYRAADVAVATKLSKPVVQVRLDQLRAAGLVEEVWVGANPPYWEIAPMPPAETGGLRP